MTLKLMLHMSAMVANKRSVLPIPERWAGTCATASPARGAAVERGAAGASSCTLTDMAPKLVCARRHMQSVDAITSCDSARYLDAYERSFAMFADAANLSQEGSSIFSACSMRCRSPHSPRSIRGRALWCVLKGARMESGTHTVSLHWLNPTGVELWSSVGELEVAAPPPNVAEMDMPLIANIDLPLDLPGAYTMRISLDSQPKADLRLQVRAPAPITPPSGMIS